jgi:hypothetical protein
MKEYGAREFYINSYNMAKYRYVIHEIECRSLDTEYFILEDTDIL